MNQIPAPRSEGTDDSRLEIVIEEKKDEIFKWLYRRAGGSVAAAQDLTQKTFEHFLIYWGKRGPFAPEDSAKVLYTIAKKRLADWYEEQNRTPAPTDDVLLLEYFTRKVPDPADQVAVRVDLQRALRQLTHTQREALTRIYVDGLDYETAAKSMGITKDNLKYHLKAAKTHAKSLLEPKSGTPTA